MKSRTFLSLPLVAVVALVACDSKPPSADNKTAASTKVEDAAWCADHDVPEAVCTKCSPNLIADFKQKGDWCDKHSLPKSQCIECDPSIKAKLAAMKPKE